MSFSFIEQPNEVQGELLHSATYFTKSGQGKIIAVSCAITTKTEDVYQFGAFGIRRNIKDIATTPELAKHIQY